MSSNDTELVGENAIEKYGLLSCFHFSELELEKSRDDFVSNLSEQDPDKKYLRLLFIQQKLGRLLEQQRQESVGGLVVEEILKLFEEQNQLLLQNPLRDSETLKARALLLEASFNKDKREQLLNTLTAGIPLVPHGSSAGVTTPTDASGYCNNGHLLTQFVTPHPKFSKFKLIHCSIDGLTIKTTIN
jgi:hypothetical protein